jgi:hypothetical protein
MKESSISIAWPEILKLLENYPTKVFDRSQIERILSDCRKILQLNQSITRNQFIDFLLKNKTIKAVKFEFPSQSFVRYMRGRVSIYEIILSLNTNSYFTQFSAMKFHNLTDKTPETIYLNIEQPPKRYHNTSLEQRNIDAAFKRPMRLSQNVAKYKKHKICILNGMSTGKLGVIDIIHHGARINVTDVERILIDIVVRPGYSGGVSEVLNAYKLAKNKLSVNKLVSMLDKLNYVYPYHQAIGFYLDQSGCYDDSSINIIHRKGLDYDFYLSHDIKEMKYSPEWRIFFPNRF